MRASKWGKGNEFQQKDERPGIIQRFLAFFLLFLQLAFCCSERGDNSIFSPPFPVPDFGLKPPGLQFESVSTCNVIEFESG